MSTAETARRLWHGLETINAVTYFCTECTSEAPQALGLRGFWMGYFANRAAPLGPVGPGVVEATFYNFHPDRVRRAIPDAWAVAAPAAVLSARAEAAATALRRLTGPAIEETADLTLRPLRIAIEDAGAGARPLFAANRDVSVPDDPVAALWQSATTLREHRGDAHVALLAGADLDGCEVHVLAVGVHGGDAELYRLSRGWSEDDWAAAIDRLAARGLLDEAGGATVDGHRLLGGIEERTDQLAARPYARLGGELHRVIDRLAVVARTIAGAGEIRFPNPMGLPAPE